MNWNEKAHATTNLIELKSLLEEAGKLGIDDHKLDWTSLPTFGGDEPHETSQVWSWDEAQVLVGECYEDLEILDRDDEDGWWNFDFSRYVKIIMQSKGVTQAEVARRCGWDRRNLDQRLRAKSPSLETLRGISGALGITVSELIGE